MYELEIILNGLLAMFKKPRDFYKEISRKEINLLIPIVVLVITGLLLTVISLSSLPTKIEGWKAAGDAQHYNLETLIKAEKIKAYLFPIWLALFWILMAVGLTYTSQALNGWSEFQGFFNCLSFLVYPYFLLVLLRFVLSLAPGLMTVYYILLFLLFAWTVYQLLMMAMGAGQLDLANAFVAFIIPGFFYFLLWLSYEPIIKMIILQPKAT